MSGTTHVIARRDFTGVRGYVVGVEPVAGNVAGLLDVTVDPLARVEEAERFTPARAAAIAHLLTLTDSDGSVIYEAEEA